MEKISDDIELDDTSITQYNSKCRYCDEIITSGNIIQLSIELMYHVVETHIDAPIG